MDMSFSGIERDFWIENWKKSKMIEGKRESIDGGECGGERDEALQTSRCRIELTVIKKGGCFIGERGKIANSDEKRKMKKGIEP